MQFVLDGKEYPQVLNTAECACSLDPLAQVLPALLLPADKEKLTFCSLFYKSSL